MPSSPLTTRRRDPTGRAAACSEQRQRGWRELLGRGSTRRRASSSAAPMPRRPPATD